MASAGDRKLMKEVWETLEHFESDLSTFQAAIEDKDVIIFLGNTRSGKSTLINYIIGNKLVAFEERHPIYKICKEDEQTVGPVIGQGSLSCTSVPGTYLFDKFVIVDAPGFDDNRGEAQDIINALYINQIKYAASAKFVLVADANELADDNVKGFTDLITSVHVLLPDFETLKDSVSIVFTKDSRDYTPADVAMLLTKKIVEEPELKVNTQLIDHFVNNDKLIAIFKMPTVAGVVGKEVDVNIELARSTSSALNLNNEVDLKVAVGDKARLALTKIYEVHLGSAYFELEVERRVKRFLEYFDIDDYVFASTNDELTDIKQNLDCILILLQREMWKTFSSLCEIENSLMKILQTNISSQFTTTFEVLIMIDDASLMEDAIRNKFITKYKASVKELMNKIQKLLDKIEEEIRERKKDNLLFNASAGVAAASGGAAVVGEVLHRNFSERSRTESPFGWLGILGGIITSVGAGVATTSYVVNKLAAQKRKVTRVRQGRSTIANMFGEGDD